MRHFHQLLRSCPKSFDQGCSSWASFSFTGKGSAVAIFENNNNLTASLIDKYQPGRLVTQVIHSVTKFNTARN